MGPWLIFVDIRQNFSFRSYFRKLRKRIENHAVWKINSAPCRIWWHSWRLKQFGSMIDVECERAVRRLRRWLHSRRGSQDRWSSWGRWGSGADLQSFVPQPNSASRKGEQITNYYFIKFIKKKNDSTHYKQALLEETFLGRSKRTWQTNSYLSVMKYMFKDEVRFLERGTIKAVSLWYNELVKCSGIVKVSDIWHP